MKCHLFTNLNFKFAFVFGREAVLQFSLSHRSAISKVMSKTTTPQRSIHRKFGQRKFHPEAQIYLVAHELFIAYTICYSLNLNCLGFEFHLKYEHQYPPSIWFRFSLVCGFLHKYEKIIPKIGSDQCVHCVNVGMR